MSGDNPIKNMLLQIAEAEKAGKCICGNDLEIIGNLRFCFGCGERPDLCWIHRNCKGNEPVHISFLH